MIGLSAFRRVFSDNQSRNQVKVGKKQKSRSWSELWAKHLLAGEEECQDWWRHQSAWGVGRKQSTIPTGTIFKKVFDLKIEEQQTWCLALQEVTSDVLARGIFSERGLKSAIDSAVTARLGKVRPWPWIAGITQFFWCSWYSGKSVKQWEGGTCTRAPERTWSWRRRWRRQGEESSGGVGIIDGHSFFVGKNWIFRINMHMSGYICILVWPSGWKNKLWWKSKWWRWSWSLVGCKLCIECEQ